MKKVLVLLVAALFLSSFVVSCTPTQLQEDERAQATEPGDSNNTGSLPPPPPPPPCTGC